MYNVETETQKSILQFPDNYFFYFQHWHQQQPSSMELSFLQTSNVLNVCSASSQQLQCLLFKNLEFAVQTEALNLPGLCTNIHYMYIRFTTGLVPHLLQEYKPGRGGGIFPIAPGGGPGGGGLAIVGGNGGAGI